MILYVVGPWGTSLAASWAVVKAHPHVLGAYPDMLGRGIRWWEGAVSANNGLQLDVFLDSGAYSAKTQGITIALDEYIAFVHQWKHALTEYACLDVIGDPVASWDNQQEMERQGLHPLPCYHIGKSEPRSWFTKYADRYERFCLGGMARVRWQELIPELDELFTLLTNADGSVRNRIHGYACTAVPLMVRYPWYSVDSTSWLAGGRFGQCFLWLNEKPVTILFSQESTAQQVEGQHYRTLTRPEQRHIDAYLEGLGFTSAQLETDYQARNMVNIEFYKHMETRPSEWQRTKMRRGFGL